ncbi:MAG: double zinc ribbon domain-containing protein [Thermoplasmata archaeon]
MDDLDTDEKGMSTGVAIAVLGLLIILATLALKFGMGPGELPIIGEYPSEVNPNGHFSFHFFAGIIFGLIVMIIGGAMSATRERVPVEEEGLEEEMEEELSELEEEIEEEGICPTCGAVIPIDAEECPECGEELEPPEEIEEEEEVEEAEEEEEEEELEEQECPICGAEVPADADECPECGEPLGEEAEEDVFEDL